MAVSSCLVSVNDSAAGEVRGRRVRALARNQPMPAPADEPEQTVEVRAHNGLNGSTVERELAPRPGFPALARMPPTARFALRGERRGLPVLTAGPVPCFYGRTPPARGRRPDLTERSGVLALSLRRGPNRGTGRLEDHDPEATGLDGGDAR